MATGPLVGVRVLEFGQIIAAPLGCQLLADLGAEVIKVEPLQGEPWRHNQPFAPGEAKVFQELNRGKRSLAINISTSEGQAAIHRIVGSMIDVVVINYRPDIAERFCIDYETLSKLRPGLIYVDSTAFGRKGELAERPGYDIVVQAVSGILGSLGVVNAAGVPPVVPPSIVDTTTGYAIATGVCAALFHRVMTGEGQKVETSLLINALTIQISGAWTFASIPAGDAALRARLADLVSEARAKGISYADLIEARNAVIRPGAGNIYYRCFETSDGVIAIGALSRSLRAKVRDVLEVQHGIDEPGYDPRDPQQREVDREMTARVEEMIRGGTTDKWEQAFIRGGVPVARVNFVQEMIDHPQVIANDYVLELEHDLTGPQYLAAPPWKMSATPPAPQGASPPLGRDTDAVLAAAGYDARQIEALRQARVVA
jgi:crotonobetainyl-CoA:carnitine CoA-transferase CaiB-like acyl-CoA transferase